MSEATPQAFDAVEFEQALAVLSSEQQAMRLSPRQRLSLRLYSGFIGGFIVFLIAVIGYLSIKLGMRDGELSAHESIVLGSLAIGGGLCLVCAVISLFLNLHLVLKIIRSRIHFRRMGFSDASEGLWRAHQKTRRLAAVGEKAALVLSALSLLLVLILFGTGQVFGGAIFICAAIVLLMFYVLQSGKARLDMMAARLAEVTKLKESILHLGNSASQWQDGRIVLPDEVVQQYSQVETDQIARSRAQAIADSLRTTKREFSILSSQQVRQVKTALPAGDRLKVEETLDALMREPRPASAQQDPGTGSLRVAVQGTGLEVIYGVDDGTSQLRVVALTPSVGSAARG